MVNRKLTSRMGEISETSRTTASARKRVGPNRRMGAAGSETWSLLLDTAEIIMRDKGYAAVTSRQLASEAGLSPQIVYFYFRTMDDLFEALFERLSQGFLIAIERARSAKNPLLMLWEISSNPSRAVLMSELISLSNHRKKLQSLISAFGVELNRRQAAIIETALAGTSVDLERWPPAVLAAILENLAKGLTFGVGYDIPSNDEARKLVARFVSELGATDSGS